MSNIRTKSGRLSKKPTRWEPQEDVIDDFAAEEYNSDESDVSSEVEFSDSEQEDESDDDSFINDDANNDDIECSSGEEDYVDDSE